MRRTAPYWIGSLWRIAALLIWIALLNHKLGPVPPLGKFLSPFEGFWRNAEIGTPHSADMKATGLDESVVVNYDRRGVPHVFSPDLYGMFYAQGYATARDRLWQMDIQSRAGLGRLAGVMGGDLLRFDLERRRMGMPASARASLEEARKDSLTWLALNAYAAGVNAWIASLSPAGYPFEFKLLDYAPEPWTPLKSVALLKNMQWTLSKGSNDALLTHTLEKFGSEFFARLYPLRNPGSDPIFPSNVFPARGPSTTLRDRAVPLHSASLPQTPLQSPQQSGSLSVVEGPRSQPGSGSDNFAIAGDRTASGHPILGNDPHLDLSLPSIWYESQLQGGDVNAYGVCIPGLPGLVIGFNTRIAWGLTNGMDDVYDLYKIRFKDSTLRSYSWNGRWQPTRFVIDTILVRGGKPVIDTEVWTQLGPVPVKSGEQPFENNLPPSCAVRWTALEPSDDIGAFLRLLPARDYGDFRDAIRLLNCPSQNFIFADSGNIALVHQGRLPIKSFGQGRTLMRGSDSGSDWHGYIPDSLLPFARNPAQGWLASANQEPVDSSYPYYLGSDFYPSDRAGRLRRLLQPMEHATLDSAWNLMLNDQSLQAGQTLPLLLRCVDSQSVSADARQALDLLRNWDYRYQANAAAPALFDLWWKKFHRLTWEDDFAGDTLDYVWPSKSVTRQLLESDTASLWFDDIRTPQRESACNLARQSLEEAAHQSRQVGGGKFATWSKIHPLTIPHLLRLAPLGTGKLSGDGCAECLNAQRGSHGPSWRMAVQLGGWPAALGGYPGGQSGNPGSPAYDAFVANWLAGRPYPLLFLKHADEKPDSIPYSITLRGAQ